MILQREVMQQNRQRVWVKVPDWFEADRVAQRYEKMFGEFDWEQVPERDDGAVKPGRLPHPVSAYLRSHLVMVEEKLESMPQLRRYLCEHPALVWLIGFRVVAEGPSVYGFRVETSVPSAGHLGVKLRQQDEEALNTLLRQSAQRVLAEEEAEVSTGVIDVKHQYAYVRQNNLRHAVAERFKPTRQPRGDRDCRLGFKACTNQTEGTAKHAGEYLWGYGSGISVIATGSKEAVVVAEATRPFDVNDVEFAPALLEVTRAVLGNLPTRFAADAAFDAQAVYAYFVNAPSLVAIPLNLRGNPAFRFNALGQPLCPTDHTPLQAGSLRQERGFPRQQFRCPTCAHVHKLFVDPAHRLRWQLDRDDPAYHHLYRQRTLVERVFSLADTYKLTRPRQRRLASVAHRNTLIYIVLNLHVLARLRQKHQVSLKDSLHAPAA